MEKVDDKKLLRVIQFAPIIIIFVATLVIVGVMIRENRIAAQQSLDSLKNEYIEQQKEQIQNQVDHIVQKLEYEKARTEVELKRQIKARVYEAHAVAEGIYQHNPNLPKDELTNLIASALRNVRFNNGHGYFFMYQMDGKSMLLPPLSHMENSNRWDNQDNRGAYFVRELASVVADKGEGYHRWWFYKPQDINTEYEKIGFVKYFEPLNSFIGTGEYVVDFEEDSKAEILRWLSEIRYGASGYVFVVDKNGVILAHQDKYAIGEDRYNFRDVNGNYFIRDILNAAKEGGKGGGFVHYSSVFHPTSVTSTEKISYVRWFDDWDWAIGTGVYLSETDSLLKRKEALLMTQDEKELMNVLILSACVLIVIGGGALVLSRYVAEKFRNFQEKINRNFYELLSTKNQMQHMALYDSLTDLPNRIQFNQVVRRAIKDADVTGLSVAVILVDLDNFKKINDLYGHSAGDKLLGVVSRKLEVLLDKSEAISRFGGDEFIFCFPNLIRDSDVQEKIHRIQKVFDEPMIIDGRKVKTSCSIGVASYPRDAMTAEELISNTDIALYRAKNRQKGSVLFFDSTIAQQVEYEFVLEEQLRGALSRNEISVLYQPQMNSQTAKIVSVEALCRWNNNCLGAISPVEFIAVAEELDLIHDIGVFVFRQACTDILSFSPNGPDAVKLSVNISPVQLKLPHFSDEIREIIRDVGIDICRITLEITENVLVEDLEAVSPILQELKDFGFGISLDDFGTGFSSLSYLNNLPINEIKIDRSFIDKILLSEQSRSLVKAIIAISESCDMHVVAEGVETEKQFNWLVEHHCDYVQGYYFDKPLSVHVLKERYGEPA
ncbi:hypothetical protein DI392_07125 [Vibrio albus]|uniref:Histidine kinase n=1 Tax=Vibrio albus TaxID=2200953 RepID=A0A2U3BB71_9VIBR|nr:cache domain-containing protein [Vibrio albus]PWI33964.1 hypothetical protein DI392_07125 [Vibrio albus]